MFNQNIKNPSVFYPFQLSCYTQKNKQLAQDIYDIRISLLLPYKTGQTAAGKWFAVQLISCFNDLLKFKVADKVKDKQFYFYYNLKTDTFQDQSGVLDTDNSFVQHAQYVSACTDANLLVNVSCLLIHQKGYKLFISCSPLLSTGQITSNVQKQKQLQTLSFHDGYNTQVSYKNGTLRIMCNPGKGLGKPQGWKQWPQFNTGNYQGMTQQQIQEQQYGILSINGYTDNVLFYPSGSVTIEPSLQDDTLTLTLDKGSL